MMRKLMFLVIILLSVTVAEAAIATINVSWQVSTAALKPSSIATISLTVSNPGVDLTNVVINSTPGPYVTITSGDRIEIGGISASQSSEAAISIKVNDNAPSTTSYVNVVIDYYTSTSNYEKTLYIPLSIIRQPILQIQNVNFSENLEPGSTSILSFDLKNEGSGDAKDVMVSLPQSSNIITSDSSGEFFINNLGRSESKTITFPITISPDASIGTTTIPVILNYYDETRSNNYNETKQIGAVISGKYNFIVTVDSQDVVTTGTLGSISIKIANAGNQEANYITLKSVSSNNFDLSPTTIYIGNLKSDDYDTEKFSLRVGSAEPGIYPLTFQISYKDPFGKSYNEVYSINAKVSSKAEYSILHQSQSPLITLIIVIVVIIIFFIFYRKGYLSKLFRRK